jgi:flagellar protein FliO/FliZ
MGTANKQGCSRRYLIAALYIMPAAAQAAPPPTYTPPAAISSGGILQIMLSLALVLALVVVVAWVLKRINFPQRGANSLLRVISGVAVGQRERIVLVEVNDTWLVVGVAPGQVRTLHTMPKGALPAARAGAKNDGTDNKFQDWLRHMLEKNNAP